MVKTGYWGINETNSTAILDTGPNGIYVRPLSDFQDDFLDNKIRNHTTFFCGGYSSNLTANRQTSIMPVIPSGSFTYTALPPVTGTGATAIQIASSSTGDSGTGTGTALMIIYYMDMNKDIQYIFTTLNGTTPTTIVGLTNVYHFMYGFSVSTGSAANISNVTCNVGTLFLGSGTFSTTDGFTTNYMMGRPGDGFVSSAHLVIPRGWVASLANVKFNGDRNNPIAFKTYFRPSRTSSWTMLAEDLADNTILIERTIAGGYQVAGGEFTVVGQPQGTGNNVSANFVLVVHAYREGFYTSAN